MADLTAMRLPEEDERVIASTKPPRAGCPGTLTGGGFRHLPIFLGHAELVAPQRVCRRNRARVTDGPHDGARGSSRR